MAEENNVNKKIDQEVEKRLSAELEQLKSKIKEEVTEEYKEKKEEPRETKERKKEEEEFFVRFRLNFRIQHVALLVTTIMLILTGIPLKFPKNSVSQFVINMFGGAPGAREVHHLFALGLILVGLYHLLYIFWAERGRKDFFELLPKLKDFSDLINQLKYYFGIRKEKVKFGRYSYVEKFDYWAVYWGLVMMIGTGLIMWLFQGKFTPLFFGEINLPFGTEIITNTLHAIAREMHSDEALLATLVIISWHFYNGHLNPHKFPMSMVWLTGKLSKKEMLDEHALEYEEIMKKKQLEELDKVKKQD